MKCRELLGAGDSTVHATLSKLSKKRTLAKADEGTTDHCLSLHAASENRNSYSNARSKRSQMTSKVNIKDR